MVAVEKRTAFTVNSEGFWLDVDKHNLGGRGYTISKII